MYSGVPSTEPWTVSGPSADVAAVYGALVKKYAAANIGIYGCSAGGILAAQSIAWFDAHDLPRPGAVAMLCAAGAELEGDRRRSRGDDEVEALERLREVLGDLGAHALGPAVVRLVIAGGERVRAEHDPAFHL